MKGDKGSFRGRLTTDRATLVRPWLVDGVIIATNQPQRFPE